MGGFSEALGALLGPNAAGLSATTVTRLKATWEDEYETWRKRAPLGKEHAYLWADGVYFNTRFEPLLIDRHSMLTVRNVTLHC